MSDIKDGGPAFPLQDASTHQFHGLSIRDYFAAKAMQGWIATYPNTAAVQDVSATGIADFAYEMADAMLAAREAK
jgi:hypothetical protein